MTIDNTIAETFGPVLSKAGFVPVSSRKWVRDRKVPIREIFEVVVMKGATYSTRWGFSLDFVPNFNGRVFKWKRTSKSCLPDLCIDPIDEAGDVPAWCSFEHLPGVLEVSSAQIRPVAEAATNRAFQDYDRVNSLADLNDLFIARSRLQYRRFSFESYTQVYLAWGLLLLSLGQDHEAEVRIGEFIRRYGIPEDDPILRQARQKAKEASSNMPEAMARQHIDLPSKTLNVEPLQPIISPLKLDDLGAKSIKELLFGSKWKRYRDSLRKQLADRGLVPDSAWGSPERLAVARKIEGILAEVCWGENFRFAPNDPYAIVGEFEIGDLSELDGVMAVEKEFGIKILWKEITAEIGECPTFGQFVDYVMRLLASNRPSPSGRSTAANP